VIFQIVQISFVPSPTVDKIYRNPPPHSIVLLNSDFSAPLKLSHFALILLSSLDSPIPLPPNNTLSFSKLSPLPALFLYLKSGSSLATWSAFCVFSNFLLPRSAFLYSLTPFQMVKARSKEFYQKTPKSQDKFALA
jgi:hypothetical protein